MFSHVALTALIYGLLIGVTYPLGAVLGVIWSPRKALVGATVGFGAGTLIPALSIDLIAPHVKGGDFFLAAGGAVFGSVFFVIINDLLNNRGAFLRKAVTTVTYLKKKKSEEFEALFRKMSRVKLFYRLPADSINFLLPHVVSRTYKKGDVIVKKGEPGDSLFIIEDGSVDIVDDLHPTLAKIATLGPHDVLGEIALVTGEARSATAIAAEDTSVSIIFKRDFDHLIHESPKVAKAVQELIQSRISDLRDKKSIDPDQAEKWAAEAVDNIDHRILLPSEEEIQEAMAAHKNAPLAIWLGNLLDTIPGGVIVGTTLVASTLSPSLIAGLCFSNFPAALSGALVGEQLNFSKKKVLWDWTSLMLVSGVAAYLGNVFFAHAPHALFVVVDGMTAGIFVNVVAETMIPEAFSSGGAVTGVATLLGFLTALLFDSLG